MVVAAISEGDVARTTKTDRQTGLISFGIEYRLE